MNQYDNQWHDVMKIGQKKAVTRHKMSEYDARYRYLLITLFFNGLEKI